MVGALQVSSLARVGLVEGVPSKQEHPWDKDNLSGVTECQLAWRAMSQISWQGEKPAVFGLVFANADRLSGLTCPATHNLFWDACSEIWQEISRMLLCADLALSFT